MAFERVIWNTEYKKSIKRSNTRKFDKESFEVYALNRAKEIDAVCIASQPNQQNVPWQELNYSKTAYVDTGVFGDERIFRSRNKDGVKTVVQWHVSVKVYSIHFCDYCNVESVEKY